MTWASWKSAPKPWTYPVTGNVCSGRRALHLFFMHDARDALRVSLVGVWVRSRKVVQRIVVMLQ